MATTTNGGIAVSLAPADSAARQQALETLEGHLQLVACAGAGKTETVARRIVEILSLPGVGAENVAAFTFTERAAAELKDRIARRYADANGASDGLADLYVGTIHAFCLRLLQQYHLDVLSFQVLTDVQQRLLISRNSRKCGLAELRTKSGKPWNRYRQAGTFAETMAILREAEIDSGALAGSEIEAILHKYENVLERHRYFDYTSILSRTADLLETDQKFCDRVVEALRFVTVDEYQDVNPIQERLLIALAERGVNVCVVGDDDQLLYNWRGTRMANMIGFSKRYSTVVQLTLDENFRSSRGVVDLAAEVIQHNDPTRLPKRMHAAGAHRYEDGDITMSAFDSAIEEAEFIASEVRRLLGTPFLPKTGSATAPRGLSYSDMVVLVRVKSLIPALTAAFDAADVPYVVGGVASLFETAEARAARALFYFFAGDASEKELKDAWQDLNIGTDSRRLAAAMRYARSILADKEAGTERYGYYNLQRSFLGFLGALGLREEAITGEGAHSHSRGEVVYYNLGKFSQIISDYEQINFQSAPDAKYRGFADYLRYQAENIYPEGWLEARYVMPDAVQIMTIHQAKGLEWPVVFVPGLVKGRFPAKGAGGIQPWSVIPEGVVKNKDDYKTTVEDERRLFYVALTRSQKFLRLSRGVYPTTKGAWRTPSIFWTEAATALDAIDPPLPAATHAPLPPQPKRQVADVILSFSELKYAFECPYTFKLRFMYGFNPPIHEALGLGKGLHDCLFELHDRVLNGGDTSPGCVDELVDRHLHVPFAYEDLRENLTKSAKRRLKAYIDDRSATFSEIEHAERPVELDAGDGVRVAGRIDLIRRRDTDEVAVIDFKSNDRTQAEEVTDLQLQVYALGYRQATGRDAAEVVVTNLDELDDDRRLPVTEESLAEALTEVLRIAELVRLNDFPKEPRGATYDDRLDTCRRCDLAMLCRDVP